MSRLFGFLFLLCIIPPVASLFCYTCVFPTISPLHCIKFPQKCPPGYVCLSSKATGSRGHFSVVLYEKSCISSSLCGLTGEKFAMGINFTFTNACCETNLCNGAGTLAGHWAGTAFSIHLLLFSTQW